MKPAVVDLGRPGLVVELTFQVLASRDKDDRFLQVRVIGRQARLAQCLDEECRVRQVGPAVVAAVARATIEGVIPALALALVPLHRFEELLTRLDRAVVAAVRVGFRKRQERNRGRVVRVRSLRQPPLRPDETFQIGQALGHKRIAGRNLSRTQQRGDDQGRDSRLALGRPSPFGILSRTEEGDSPLDQLRGRLRGWSGGLGRFIRSFSQRGVARPPMPISPAPAHLGRGTGDGRAL